MTGQEEEEAVLSNEELEALLEKLSDKAGGSAWAGNARKDVASEEKLVSLALQRASEEFADRISRSMSNVFQVSIRFSLIDWRDSDPEEFEQLMVPTDRAVSFDVAPGAGRGVMLVGRTLLFQLLCLNFGASPGLKSTAPPLHPYTSIECRFYKNFAEDLLKRFGEAWSEETRIETKIAGLIGRDHVREEAAEELYLATYDVSGFGEVCRLRVAVPKAAFENRVAAAREVTALSGAPVEETVLDMELGFRAEIGSIQMSLRQFSSMSEGDVIPIDCIEGGELLATVGGVPKFHAIRGAVGRRLAVQLMDRV